MNSDFQTLVTAVKGERILGKEAQSFKGVSIDSRTVRQDQLFICIKGDRFDGHDFIDEVAQKKAAGVVVSDKEKLDGSRIKDSGLFAVAVPDTIRALQDLAEYHRNRFDVRVIGVTGTNGKTTTKEIIANVIKMKYPALKTEGNLNNHIGLPLTLLELSRSHKSAVLEMGMSAAGEIRRLAEIAKPRIGVITNISMAHMTHLKTLKDIQAAKGELFRELNQYGTAVVNADDPLVCELARKIRAKVITFGIENKADVQASDIRPGNFSGYDFTLSLKGKQVPAHVPLIGRFNIYNALAAAAVGYVLEVPVSMIQNGLKARQDLHQRCESILYKNMTILNDTYNANPRSMSEAMKILKEHKAPGKKIMVVGDMLELGNQEHSAHQKLGVEAAQTGFDYFITVGERAGIAAKAAVQSGMAEDRAPSFDSHQAAADFLKKILEPGDCALFKGSRGAGMEKVVKAIMNQD